ncbi:MAG: Mov34/MPN/PAD-1 family protein [Prevotella sp.]|nr:Mov34/MPN/PAD-1 family protein [Prevotella sp.]
MWYAKWHSHPASPSRPSSEDIRLANDPNILYAISPDISVRPSFAFYNTRDEIDRLVAAVEKILHQRQ